MKLELDYIVCGYGSAGTYGGLVLGKKYFKNNYNVIGICVSNKSENQIEEDRKYMNNSADEFDMNIKINEEDLWIEKGFVGEGYNIPDNKTREIIYYVASKEGIILDPCYTGKAFNGMLQLIRDKRIKPDSNILFIHTGGTPGIYTKEHLEHIKKELW